MATPQQIDEQVKLERLQISQGIEQLRKNTKQLETKSVSYTHLTLPTKA